MANPNKSKTTGVRSGRDTVVHGNLLNVVSSKNTSKPGSSHSRKGPFRFNIPTATPHYKGRQATFDNINNHFGYSASWTALIQKVLSFLSCWFFFKAIFQWLLPQLVNNVNCWDHMVAIVGMGGIGKTELACQFAKKHRKIYPCAAWIHAETQQSALDSFLGLAKLLGIVPQHRKKADLELVKNVYQHIDAHYRDKVLLIFDNAIQLHSENDFGIFDYLPTEDLANQRFPYVIITSQTSDWQKGITTFQLDELSEQESVAFFRSSFKILSSECDEAFKNLHTQLQGYPLALTLASSNIDFESDKHSFNWLRQEIEEFIEKFEKEDSSILTHKINQNSANKYNKSLSTVWQLSFKRLQAERNGANALMLLQAISFFHVPVKTQDLRLVFIECPYCPETPSWMKYGRLKKSIRLLQKFHLIDALFTNFDYSNQLKALQSNAATNSPDLSRKFEEEVKSAKSFGCELRVHRLVQLVVRLDMECRVVLKDILRYLALWARLTYVRQVNVSAVEEAIGRAILSNRASAFVGLFALQGNPAARRFVQMTITPVKDPAASIWRILQLDKSIETLNEEIIEVLRAFIRLSTAEKSLIDKRCFAFMALRMFHDRRIFPYVREDGTSAPGIFLRNFMEIEGIVSELFSSGCSFTDVCSLPLLCVNAHRADVTTLTVLLGNGLIEGLTRAKKPKSQIVRIKEELRTFRELVDHGNDKWHQYQEELTHIFNSGHSWLIFEFQIKICGFDQLKLKQVFSAIFDKIWSASGNKNFDDNFRAGYVFRELDAVIHKFLKTPRPREVLIPLMDSFIEILVKTEREQLSVLQDAAGNDENAVIWICSASMNFCIHEGCMNLNDLSRRLSRVRIVTEMKKIPSSRIRDGLKVFGNWKYLQERHQTTYDKFMQIYSKSSVEEIKTLVTFCQEIQEETHLAINSFGYR